MRRLRANLTGENRVLREAGWPSPSAVGEAFCGSFSSPPETENQREPKSMMGVQVTVNGSQFTNTESRAFVGKGE